MAQLPTFTRQTVPNYSQGLPPMASVEAGGMSGRMIARAGEGALQAGEQTQRYLTTLKRQEAADYVATSMAGMADTWHTKFLQERDAAPEGAQGFTETFMKAYDADLESKVQAAPNQIARNALKERGLDLRTTLHANALTFEHDSGVAMRVNNLDQNANKIANIAVTSPELYGDLAKQLDDTLAAYKGVLPPKEWNKASKAYKRQLGNSALAGSIDKDPQATIGALKSGKFDDILEPEDKSRLLNAADAEIKRREAQARAEARAAKAEERAQKMALQFSTHLAYQDELAAAADGKTINPNIDKDIAAAYDPPHAKAMLDQLHNVREEGSLANSMATMTPEQMGQAMAEVQPSGAGYAEEAKSRDRLAKVQADVIKRRTTDPAAEAARAFPEIADDQASDDPAQRAAGIRRSLEVQRQVFQLAPDQVKPLTKDGASRLVKAWQTSSSDEDRVRLLQSVTELPGSDGKPDDTAAQAILRQLEQAGLPAGTDLALEAARRGDTSAATKIMGALSLKPDQLPKLTQEDGTKVADELKKLRDPNSESGTSIDSRTAAILGESGTTKADARGEDVTKKLITMQVLAGVDPKVAAKQADAIVHGTGPKINNNFASVKLPQGSDPQAVATGLSRTRSNVDLSYLSPQEQMRQGQVTLRTKALSRQESDAIAKDQRFNTQLTPEEEAKFQEWKKVNAPNDSGYDYDLRGAFKAGLSRDADTGHMLDQFKKPNHPTFSNQSQYAKDRPDLAGSWAGDKGDLFIPPGRQPGEVAGLMNQAGRSFDHWQEMVRDSGHWINWGSGFALIVQPPGASYGQPVPGPDGKPRIWSMDEVMQGAGAAANGRPAQPAAPAPDVYGAEGMPGAGGGAGSDLLRAADAARDVSVGLPTSTMSADVTIGRRPDTTPAKGGDPWLRAHPEARPMTAAELRVGGGTRLPVSKGRPMRKDEL